MWPPTSQSRYKMTYISFPTVQSPPTCLTYSILLHQMNHPLNLESPKVCLLSNFAHFPMHPFAKICPHVPQQLSYDTKVLLPFLPSLLFDDDSVFPLRCIFFILALWFWNQTCTTRTLRPVSLANASLTFLQGFGLISNDALNCLLCIAVRIVLGLFGPLRPSREERCTSNKTSSAGAGTGDKTDGSHRKHSPPFTISKSPATEHCLFLSGFLFRVVLMHGTFLIYRLYNTG